MKVWIQYSDGVYTLTEAPTDREDAVVIPDAVWAAYRRFCDKGALWHSYIRLLDDWRNEPC